MSKPTPPGPAPHSAPLALVDLDDRALLARHSAGDREAFAELVRRHRDRLWRVATRTLGNAEDAADALQDALLSAYRAAAGFRGDAAVTTWLHRIVVNACLDQVRRRAVRPTVPLDETAAAERATPDAYGARETAAEILAALRRLPIEQAAAIVLVDIEGYPVAEVAAILEVPVGTVKSRCARGRARLAETLHHLDGRNPAADRPVPLDDPPTTLNPPTTLDPPTHPGEPQ
ncbi:MAG: polymerase sigma-70 factor, subfamily [Frankiaceae bacterium]|jgi:RNA polymerase sigma-70 factor (ECF subfamily)|nr:polymerase sigma-70 factor, subfamily [Frankiaceae bacterium]